MTPNKNVTSARHMKDSELFTTMKGKKYLSFTKDDQIFKKTHQLPDNFRKFERNHWKAYEKFKRVTDWTFSKKQKIRRK